MIINFIKLHSYGNDFVVFDLRDANYNFETPELIFLGDRNFGIGCDHLIILSKSSRPDDEKSAFFAATMYNQEGLPIENSLGGMRCLIGYLSETISKPLIKIETPNGVVSGKCDRATNIVKINAGIPQIDGNSVSIGGNHNVQVPENIDNIDTAISKSFSKVYIKIKNENNIFIRSIESSVGEVFTSASAIAAAAVYCIHNGLTSQQLNVETRGSKILGETIAITWAGAGQSIIQGGKYAKVFTGQIDI